MTPKKDWKPRFLDVFRESGNVTESAKAAGVTKQAAYKARNTNKTFRTAWDSAREEIADDLEAEAFKRAKDSSDTLLIFLLKGLKSDTYGDKRKLVGADDGPIRFIEVADDGKDEEAT